MAVVGTMAGVCLQSCGAVSTGRRRRRRGARGCRRATGATAAVKTKAATSGGSEAGRRPRVLVLGSGWGAVSFIQGLSEEEAQMYDITVVSPRNHFLYTPLLPTCTMGSIEERSICTPIRRIIAGKASFMEAICEHIDPATKTIRCSRAGNPAQRAAMDYDRFPAEDVEGKLTFELCYDILVFSVGAVPNDFNCPGVKEHAFLFKEVEHARNIRNKISDVFEKAALPMMDPEERDALLSFVIVGGGPTGVEVAADLCDFIREDVGLLYPDLVDHVKVRLINTGEHLLSTYDRDVSDNTLEVFNRNGVEVLKGYRVKEITDTEVKAMRKSDKALVDIKYGCIVWCTGIKQNGLSAQLKASIKEMNEDRKELHLPSLQENRTGVVTDEWLQVKGSWGSIFALGDAATAQAKRATVVAQELFEQGDKDGGGTLCVYEMKDLFRANEEKYPQLKAYSKYLEVATNEIEPESVRDDLAKFFSNLAEVRKAAEDLTSARVTSKTASVDITDAATEFARVDVDGNAELDEEEFMELVRSIDQNLRSFPATAQVAAQQGKYLAKVFATGTPTGNQETYLKAREKMGPFTYFHKGSLAYLGDNTAAFDVPLFGPFSGPIAGLAWKAYETAAQVSWKSRVLVGLDWVRTELFGRDTSRF